MVFCLFWSLEGAEFIDCYVIASRLHKEYRRRSRSRITKIGGDMNRKELNRKDEIQVKEQRKSRFK